MYSARDSEVIVTWDPNMRGDCKIDVLSWKWNLGLELMNAFNQYSPLNTSLSYVSSNFTICLLMFS